MKKNTVILSVLLFSISLAVVFGCSQSKSADWTSYYLPQSDMYYTYADKATGGSQYMFHKLSPSGKSVQWTTDFYDKAFTMIKHVEKIVANNRITVALIEFPVLKVGGNLTLDGVKITKNRLIDLRAAKNGTSELEYGYSIKKEKQILLKRNVTSILKVIGLVPLESDPSVMVLKVVITSTDSMVNADGSTKVNAIVQEEYYEKGKGMVLTKITTNGVLTSQLVLVNISGVNDFVKPLPIPDEISAKK